MFEIQILIPSFDNGGKPFPESAYERWEKHLIGVFGGYSRYPGQVAGGWMENGTIYHDKSFVYGVAVAGMVDGQKVIDAAKFAQRLFKQEAMFLRYLGQTEFVS